MRPFENEVNDFVGEIWSSMLGMDITPDDRARHQIAPEDAFISRVGITGTWIGTVGLHCGSRLALDLASIMFDARPELISADMIADALGEVTNMISGCFKSLLPGPCDLSLPTACRPGLPPGPVQPEGDPGGYGFRCLGRPFLVTLDRGGNDR